MKLFLICSMAMVCLVSARHYTARVTPDVYKPIVKKEINQTHEAIAALRQDQANEAHQKTVSLIRKRDDDFDRAIRRTFGQHAMVYTTRFSDNYEPSKEKVSQLRLSDDGQTEFRKAMYGKLRELNRRTISRP